MPEFFTPPNGRSGALLTVVLTPDHADVEPIGDLVGLVEVTGEDRAAQAVRGVVGQRDCLVDRIDLVDNGYRSEQLLVVGAHLRGDAGEHRRRVEGPGPVGHLAAEVDLGALGDGVLDLVDEIGAGRKRRHRSQPGVLARRVAEAPFAGLGDEPVQELVEDRGFDDHPLR